MSQYGGRSAQIECAKNTGRYLMAGNASCAIATCTSARLFWDWTG